MKKILLAILLCAQSHANISCFPGNCSGGGGGGGIASINGDTTAAQLIVGGAGITVGTSGGTTTVTNTGQTSAISFGPFGSSPNSSGGSISGGAITLQPADATNPGGISTTAQSLPGLKTFPSGVNISTLTASQAVFTDASKNLVSNAVTGTGSVVMSASPTFTGTVKYGNCVLNPSETDNGNSSTAITIDLSTAAVQRVKWTGNATVTLSNPQTACTYMIKAVNDGTVRTITWPAAVLWSGGTAPVFTGTNNKVDLVTLYYDGTSYYGNFSLSY